MKSQINELKINPIIKVSKQKILLLFLLIGMISFNTSCKDDDDTSTNPVDQLPPLTHTGANRAGCLVNGEALLPAGGGSSPNLVCNYQEIDGEKYFNFHFSHQNSTTLKGIQVVLSRVQIIQNTTYILDKNIIDNGDFSGGGKYEFYQSSPTFNEIHYHTTPIKTGELKITYLNEATQVVSGTFWFDAISSSGGVVQVRDGRFDVTYSL